MNTFSTKSNLRFASTFLSHSSTDKPLVEAVAKRLSRRGILVWLDREELTLGPLDTALKDAVHQQATLTIFLSEASVASSWCRDELRWALEAQEGYDHVLPVYLDDPLKLLRGHDLLRSRFLHQDGDRVNQNGVFWKGDPTNPDPDYAAEAIATTIYRRSVPQGWSEVVIVLDQRGAGPRQGPPELPENFASSDIPVLTFRPHSGLRESREMLIGSDWEDMAKVMSKALSKALGTVRGRVRKVRVLGNAQTGLMWAVGSHFDRTTDADLYVYGRDEIPISNKGQVRHTSLIGGDPDRAKLMPATSNHLSDKQLQIALGVGSEQKFAQTVQLAAPQLPLFWIDEPGFISDSEQAMGLVADVVASVNHLRQEHGVRELVLFWTTANHVAVLAAANLTSHVIPAIRFMEWDHARAEYIHLPMPKN